MREYNDFDRLPSFFPNLPALAVDITAVYIQTLRLFLLII